MTSASQRSRIAAVARPAFTLLAVATIAASTGGCFKSGPRFDAPFTLANPTERHPIAVTQGEATLDLAVYPGGRGLNTTQKAQLYAFLQDYKSRGAERLLVKAPSGAANETAAMRAYDDVRRAMRNAGINPGDVALEPYFANWDPAAPLRLSYLQAVAVPPDCPDWSESLARDPQNMPSPNMGCATQRNLAAMVSNPEDLLGPRTQTPRPSERRDVVWGKYIRGEATGSIWAPGEQLPERATASDIGGDQ